MSIFEDPTLAELRAWDDEPGYQHVQAGFHDYYRKAYRGPKWPTQWPLKTRPGFISLSLASYKRP